MPLRTFALLSCAVAVEAFFAAPFAPTSVPSTTARRAATPTAGLFDDFKKIVDYNTKFAQTAIAGMTDSRTASASHVLFGFAKYQNGESMAAEIKTQIESGDLSFADAASQFSTCPSASRGGDLGTFKRGAMVPEFDAACFDEGVELGSKVYGPIKTQFGYHLIQVNERSDM